jgi:hypothetical protein
VLAAKDGRHRNCEGEVTKRVQVFAFEMPEGGNTVKEAERGISLENQQKPLKYVPFIFKRFPVWKIAYKVNKTALWKPSKISGVDSHCKLQELKERGQQL